MTLSRSTPRTNGASQPDAGLSVSELGRRTGVPVPTIHHYRRLGLLPEPERRGPRRFVYDQRHVEALRLIRLLRERRKLSLTTIGRLLPELLPAKDHQALGAEVWEDLLKTRGELGDGNTQPGALLGAARGAFAARGYDGVSVGELCEMAGIAKGTFYRHFSSKEEVFAAAVRSVGEEVAEAAGRLHKGIGLHQAAAALEPALAPYTPMVLEAASKELRGDPTLAGCTSALAATIAAAVATRLRNHGRLEAAHQVVRLAMIGAVHRTLDNPPRRRRRR